MYERGERVFHMTKGYGTVEHSYQRDGITNQILVTFDRDGKSETFVMHEGKPWRGADNQFLDLFLVDDELKDIIEKLKHHA